MLQKPLRQFVVILHLAGVISARAHTVRIEECGILLPCFRIDRDAVGTDLHTLYLSILHLLHEVIVGDFLIGGSRQHLHKNTDAEQGD